MAALVLAPGVASGSAGGFFTEITDSGFDFVHFNGMSGGSHIAEITSGGGAVFDYDNDGDLDLYLAQGQMLDPSPDATATFPPRHPLPLTDRLYRNDLEVAEDGSRRLRFTDVTEVSGLTPGGYGFGVAAGDVDNDGWTDLYVTRLGANALLRNNGAGPDGQVTFTDVTIESGAGDDRWSVPAAFVDLDHDGWLDLYVGNYLELPAGRHKTCHTATGARDYCGPSAYPGVPDRLLRNRGARNGGVTFEDVSASAGILGQRSKSLGVIAADFDGDGLTDVYVANDLTPNQMWIQQTGGRFRDRATPADVRVHWPGGGVEQWTGLEIDRYTTLRQGSGRSVP